MRWLGWVVAVVVLPLLIVYLVILAHQSHAAFDTQYDYGSSPLLNHFDMKHENQYKKRPRTLWGRGRSLPGAGGLRRDMQQRWQQQRKKERVALPAYVGAPPPDHMIMELFGEDLIKRQVCDVTSQDCVEIYDANPATAAMKRVVKEGGARSWVPQYAGIKKMTELGDPGKFPCEGGFCFVNNRTIKREILRETPQDMFELLPQNFLKEFRNPCWKGQDLLGVEKLFCLPYFYIVGFTKCGTTDLFAILNNHTLVSAKGGKESHYIDRQRRGRSPAMSREPIGGAVSFLSWVHGGRFRPNLLYTYEDRGGDQLFHGITMDATPSHVWDNEYWETFHPNHTEPPVTNPDVISAFSPGAKIIVSLRDPIKRMQSAYQFFCAMHVYPCNLPITNAKFHALVLDAVARFNACLLGNTVRGCVYSTSTHQLATHLYASIYSVYLADWLAAFPREQVHVLKMEEHVAHQADSVNDICNFLQIPRFSEGALKEYLSQHQTRNSMSQDLKLPYLLPETIALLKDFFKPFLSDLVELLGDEKWYWDY